MYVELGTFTLNQLNEVSATLTSDFDKISLYDLKDKL